ncbi:MAG: methyltransferase [Rhodoblastus sp.]|nr:MAG: methyltransferase [Rhodoblastus sp.]
MFFGARLRLLQPARGHRFGHDAALLAASCPAGAGAILDAGSGVGAAGLAAATRDPSARLTLLEIDPALAGLAAENLSRNGLAARGRAVAADLLRASSRRAVGLAAESFDLVLTNPPFLDADAARVSPDPARARAHALAPAAPGRDALADWLRACLACLAPGGGLRVIHRADALARLLAAVQGRAGAIRLAPIRPRPGAPATRVLLAAIKGSKAPLRLEEGVALTRPDGGPDPLAQALLEGRARFFEDASRP